MIIRELGADNIIGLAAKFGSNYRPENKIGGYEY